VPAKIQAIVLPKPFSVDKTFVEQRNLEYQTKNFSKFDKFDNAKIFLRNEAV